MNGCVLTFLDTVFSAGSKLHRGMALEALQDREETARQAGGAHYPTHTPKMKCVLNRLLAGSQMLVEPSGKW